MPDTHPPLEGKVSLNTRPVRMAYFVAEDDEEGLRRAVQLCCTQWGGIRNLIIPVDGDTTIPAFFSQLLEIHPPHRFVSYVSEADPQSSVRRHALEDTLGRLWPHREVELLDGALYETHDMTMHALCVSGDPQLEGYLRVCEFEGSDLDKLALLTVFGAIYPNQKGEEECYRAKLHFLPAKASFSCPEIWDLQSDLTRLSPLAMTGLMVSPRAVGAGTADYPYFEVVVSDQVPGLCYYWCSRAIRESTRFSRRDQRTLLMLPRQIHEETALPALIELVRKAEPYSGRSCGVDIAFSYCDEEHRTALCAKLAEQDRVLEVRGGELGLETWGGFTPPRKPREANKNRTIMYSFCRTMLPVFFKEAVDPVALPRNATFDYGPNELLFEMPGEFVAKYLNEVDVDLQFTQWGWYPRSKGVANLIKSNSWFSDYGLSTTVMALPAPVYFEFTLPTEREALRAYLQDRGYESRLSRSGQYARAVIGLVGGLRRTDVFANPVCYRVLDKLALKSSKKIAQRLIRKLGLHDVKEEDLISFFAGAEVIAEMKRVPKTCEQLASAVDVLQKDLLPLLSQLVDKGIVRRGFNCPCPKCGAPTWYPLDSLSERLSCPGCSYQFVLPVERSQGHEARWEYTLNTLVNRAMDQDVLPHIIALWRLAKDVPEACVVPGLDLLPVGSEQVEAEFDFVFVRDQELFAGECKAGTELEQKDIDAARLALTLGFRQFDFCSVSGFSNQAKELVQDLVADAPVEHCKAKIGYFFSNSLQGIFVGPGPFKIEGVDLADL